MRLGNINMDLAFCDLLNEHAALDNAAEALARLLDYLPAAVQAEARLGARFELGWRSRKGSHGPKVWWYLFPGELGAVRALRVGFSDDRRVTWLMSELAGDAGWECSCLDGWRPR